MHFLRPAAERGHTQTKWLDSYHTFSFGNYYDPQFMGFSDLRVINDDIVEPAQGFDMHPHNNMEIISVVLSGELEHKDSLGNGSVIRAGEIQKMTAGSGQTVKYKISADRAVWLQIAAGSVTLNDTPLVAGDGYALWDEDTEIELRGIDNQSNILLFNLSK